MNNARLSAFKALLHVDVNEGYSNIVLDKTLAEFSMDSRDKALASAIFYGVLERRITLNYIIKQCHQRCFKFYVWVYIRYCILKKYQIQQQ